MFSNCYKLLFPGFQGYPMKKNVATEILELTKEM